MERNIVVGELPDYLPSFLNFATIMYVTATQCLAVIIQYGLRYIG